MNAHTGTHHTLHPIHNTESVLHRVLLTALFLVALIAGFVFL